MRIEEAPVVENVEHSRGASSTSCDSSIPPGFETHNRFHGFHEEA